MMKIFHWDGWPIRSGYFTYANVMLDSHSLDGFSGNKITARIKYSKPSDNGENNALCSSKAEKHFCWAFNKQQFRGNIKLSLTFRQGLHTSVSENFV